jgi:hypothetical protein
VHGDVVVQMPRTRQAIPGRSLLRRFPNHFRYDVTPDCQKFLIDAVAADEAATRRLPITVVLNWQTLLKK